MQVKIYFKNRKNNTSILVGELISNSPKTLSIAKNCSNKVSKISASKIVAIEYDLNHSGGTQDG